MRYILLAIIAITYTGCGCSSDNKNPAICKAIGYKGMVSENNIVANAYCSNGELINGNFLTDEGAKQQTWHVRGRDYTLEYIEFK